MSGGIVDYDLDAYPAIKMSKSDKFYDHDTSLLLKFAEENRYFTADDFRYCTILNGAKFDALVPIRPLQGSIAQVNPDQSVFTNIIDKRAYELFKQLLKKHRTANRDELHRLCCYTAAEGHSSAANLTHERLLVEIDPINYFKPLIPAIEPVSSIIPGSRKKFKIAYLLMIHEYNGFPHVQLLLKMLDDGDAIILIHVDARPKSNALYTKMESWIAERTKELDRPSNIFMAKYRFNNIWGHVSLVLTQLSGFWELLDMADWDYVINLSNYDYPIKSNAVIHKYLSLPKNKNKNWIEYWPDTRKLD